MSQLIEGVDNEITLAFFLFTGAAAIAVPWYFFRPNTRHLYNRTYSSINENPNNEASHEQASNETVNERTTNTESDGPDRFETGQPYGESRTRNSAENSSYINGSNERAQEQSSHQHDTERQTSNNGVANISIKVKHNAVDTIVSVPKTMTLINFKRHCYNAEMEQGKNVRLIYNGRILAGDHYTLEFLGISNGCVIHAQISEHQSSASASAFVENNDLDIGFLFVPLMTFAFIVGWTMVVAYEDLFSTTSIIILSFLSVIFILMVYVI